MVHGSGRGPNLRRVGRPVEAALPATKFVSPSSPSHESSSCYSPALLLLPISCCVPPHLSPGLCAWGLLLAVALCWAAIADPLSVLRGLLSPPVIAPHGLAP